MNSIAQIRKQLLQVSRQIDQLTLLVKSTQRSVNQLDTNCVGTALSPNNSIWHSREFFRASRIQRG